VHFVNNLLKRINKNEFQEKHSRTWHFISLLSKKEYACKWTWETSLFCCVWYPIWCQSSVLLCQLRFPHKNVCRGSMSYYGICICLHIVESSTYCVVFLLWLSSAYVLYLLVYLDCPLWLPLRYIILYPVLTIILTLAFFCVLWNVYVFAN
jgi:hypothetical protein